MTEFEKSNATSAALRTILIIDDDLAVMTFVQSVLVKAGYRVLTADTGAAGLVLARREQPDVILLDRSGLDICRSIKSGSSQGSCYVILISAMKITPKEQARGLDAGADGYMRKPLAQSELLARVEAMLRIKQTEEQLRKVSHEYEMVFQGTQEGLFLVAVENETSFRFIRNNHAHQKATGISIEMLRGKTPEELLGDELGKQVSANCTRCLRSGEPIAYEEVLDLPAGRKIWHTTLIPVRENNTITFLVGSSQDITQRKQAEERLQIMATTDELTGLWNRRHFMDHLQQEVERGKRFGQFFSVMMLDIDHFKKVNDNHGHAVGDAALRHVAQVIRNLLRQVDVPGRFGGEEFAVILPQTHLDGAFVLAERLRIGVEQAQVPVQDKTLTLTVSIGVAEFDRNITDPDQVLKLADDALYAAKNAGRNRTMRAKSSAIGK
jgi:diguanylate cyclase (GGDEF)-like protein/PAS domain S-box-containing protein